MLKGVGILGVVVLHCFGRSASKFEKLSPTWDLLEFFNVILNVCVPVFLALSALMYARSEARNPQGWRGVPRRLGSLVYPYVVFSLLYTLANKALNHGKIDWYKTLVWGKAEFHLYFLIILIQFALFFPVWVWVAQQVKRFRYIVFLSVLIQAAIMLAQNKLKFLPYPGSSDLWYVIQLLVSVWLGLNWKDRQQVLWQPLHKAFFGLCVLLGGIIYTYEQWLPFIKEPQHGNWSNYGMLAFQFGAAMLLFGLLGKWQPRSKFGEAMVTLGSLSLGIYLIHPAIMEIPRLLGALQKRAGVSVDLALAWVQVWPFFLVATLAISYFVVRALYAWPPLGKAIFGRT